MISGTDPNHGIDAVTLCSPASRPGVYVIGSETPLSNMTTSGANTPPPTQVLRCTTDRNHSSGRPALSSTRTVTGIDDPPTSGVPTRETITRALSNTFNAISE